jgi:spore coat polysaccharide biosynthesis protein SpsF
MKVLGILQARVSSTRLPGKVLLPILDQPMLARQIERVKRAKFVNNLVVATSNDSSDDQIQKLCTDFRVDCYRGSLNDVLDRFYQVAKLVKPDHIVRLTGDCPLIDSMVIDQVIEYHLQKKYDYTSNVLEPTYPDGLDVEVMKADVLSYAWGHASLQSQREHVTLYINQHPEIFSLGCLKNNVDLSSLRWTVDELEDYEFVSKVYQELYQNKKNFNTNDILTLLKQKPELIRINVNYKRNSGLEKSLLEDKEFS